MSAIDDMMAMLAQPPAPVGQGPTSFGSAPTPAVMSSAMPQFHAPPMNSPHTGLLDRVKENLGHLLGGISDAVRPSAPGGYDGLLTPEEIQNARPSFLHSLIGAPDGPSASQRYQGNLDHVVALKDLKAKNALAQQHDALRSSVGEVLSDTTIAPAERYARLTKMMGVAFQLGDEKSMGAIANAMQSAKPPAAPAAKTYEPKPFTLKDGSMAWIKPGDAIPAGAKPFHEPSAPQQPILITGTGPDGQPSFGLVNKGDGKATPITGMTPKVTTGASSAQNAASEALLRSSVSEMHNADSFMREYEDKLATGKTSINGLSQFMGGLGNAFTHDDPASRAIQNTALTALNKINPELARYIRRGLSFAEGEAGISKRPSDFRTKMATFLSTAASGASPEMIHDIQGRRGSILTPLMDVVSRMGGSTSKGSGSATGAIPPYDPNRKY